MEIINSKKKMKFITKEQQESCERTKICYICEEKNENIYVKDKKCCKVTDHCNYTGESREATRIDKNGEKNTKIYLVECNYW